MPPTRKVNGRPVEACAAHNLRRDKPPNELYLSEVTAQRRVCYCCQMITANSNSNINININDRHDNAGAKQKKQYDYFDSSRRDDFLRGSPHVQTHRAQRRANSDERYYLASIASETITNRKAKRKRRRRRLLLESSPPEDISPPSPATRENITSFVKTTNCHKHHLLSSPARATYYFVLLLASLTLLLAATLFKPTLQTSVTNTFQYNVNSNTAIQPFGGASSSVNKNSGHFHISQLCAARIPITRRVEGVSLSAGPTDTDVNCTITFRTKSAQQHFVIRFEELKLGCDDHLILFDGDLDYGQPSIKDFSCRDNMASVPTIKTTGTFLTLRYASDGLSKMNDGFRLVATAVFDMTMSDCPAEYVFCRSQLCVSRSLFCDGINHCLDNSDEMGCHGPDDSPIELPYALGFFVMLILIISTGVLVCIILHCRRADQHSAAAAAAAMHRLPPYAAAQYQQQLQRAFNFQQAQAAAGQHHLQASSSFMFPAGLIAAAGQGRPGAAGQYQQFFQTSPYVTPQHQVHYQQVPQPGQQRQMIATLPRGYSTLPLNLLRPAGGGQQQQTQTVLASKANHQLQSELMNEPRAAQDYVMMTAPGAHLIATAHPMGNHVMAPGGGSGGGMIIPVSSPMHQQQMSQATRQQAQQVGTLAASQSILSSSTTTTVAPAGVGRAAAAAAAQRQQQQIRSPASSNASSGQQQRANAGEQQQ